MKINSRWLPDADSHNVIGEIRGSEFPDRVILIGGHLDSWDVAPGAHDNGSGVVQSIEVLRLFRALGIQPKHTLRCVLFTNEENGLRGSAAYASSVKTSGEKHLLAIETDSGILLTPYAEETERALRAAARAAKKYRSALRELAK